MKKFASEGDGCNSNMDIEFQKAINKKKKSGKSDGQAILDWLEENQKENKVKSVNAKNSLDNLLKIGRPN